MWPEKRGRADLNCRNYVATHGAGSRIREHRLRSHRPATAAAPCRAFGLIEQTRSPARLRRSHTRAPGCRSSSGTSHRSARPSPTRSSCPRSHLAVAELDPETTLSRATFRTVAQVISEFDGHCSSGHGGHGSTAARITAAPGTIERPADERQDRLACHIASMDLFEYVYFIGLICRTATPATGVLGGKAIRVMEDILPATVG